MVERSTRGEKQAGTLGQDLNPTGVEGWHVVPGVPEEFMQGGISSLQCSSLVRVMAMTIADRTGPRL